MEKDNFTSARNSLIQLVNDRANAADISIQEKNDLEKILEIFDQYSFENRLLLKGLLAHTIIDSLQVEYSLGRRCIEFDRSIQ